MQKMTPMKRLSGNFEALRNLLGENHLNYTLNKSQSRSIPYVHQMGEKYETLGVKNDFVSIFFLEKDKYPSFAFVCNYMNKNEPVTFTAQLKTSQHNDSIANSVTMDFAGFRIGLNLFCKKLKEIQGEKRFQKLAIEEFASVFLNDGVSPETAFELEKFRAHFENHELTHVVSSLIEKTEAAKLEMEEALENSIAKIKEIPEINEIKQLRLKLQMLESIVKSKSEAINLEHKVKEKSLSFNKLSKENAENKVRLSTAKSEYLKGLPPMVRRTVQTEIARDFIKN